MKGKLLLSVTIASLFSINAFALNIQKGHLMSHKEWSTGNLSYSFKNQKNLATISITPSNKSNSDETLNTQITPATGITNSPVTLTATDSLSITNNSTSSKTFSYVQSICVNTTSRQCAYYSDQIQLDPGGSAVIANTPLLSISFDSQGNYSTETSEYITDENNSQYGSVAVSTVQIS